MIAPHELTIEDYKTILRRRIWIIIIPAVVLAISAYAVSLFLPSRYVSATVVLVEEPAVPENFVKQVIGGDVNQRLATMQEQILSRTRLADFQRRYMGELPDETQTNFSLLSGMTSQLEASSQALSRAHQDKIFVESMLSQQIEAEKLTHVGSSPVTFQKQLGTLEDELAALRSRYTDEHPDVIKVKSEIARLQKRIQEEASAGSPPTTSGPDKEGLTAETLQAKQLRAQLFQINQTIRERTAEQTRLQEGSGKGEAKLEPSPAMPPEKKTQTQESPTAAAQ